MALWADGDLAAWVQSDVDPAVETMLRRAVTGLFTAEVGALPTVIPDGLWALALRVGARLLENPTGLKSEGLAGYTVSYGDVELTASELRTLRRTVSTSRSYSVQVPRVAAFTDPTA